MKVSFISIFAKRPLLPIAVAAGLLLLGLAGGCGPSPPEKVYSGNREAPVINIITAQDRVSVRGFSEETLVYLRETTAKDEMPNILGIYALSPGQEWTPSVVPATGSWRVTDEELRFEARHPWLPGTRYYVRLDANTIREGAGLADTTFVLPPPEDMDPQRVAAVYPSADTLPQNLLKFYIRFSGPMSRGEVYEHISIKNRAGEVIPDAFLELPRELWDPRTTRLTLLFDPGRIKRGLERHNLMGTAFKQGKVYTLEIDRTLKDANGLFLAAPFRKRFYITGPDRTMPDPEQWTLTTPGAQSRGPLVLKFNEPLDHALLKRVIKVVKGEGELTGRVETGDEERSWRFIPERPWQPGEYEIRIQKILEDLSGNNLISVFDVDRSTNRVNQENTNKDSTIVKRFTIE